MPGQPGPSAGCSIGWLSERQVPWGIPTIWPGMEDLGPEWGVPHYSGPIRKIFDEPSELAGEDYGRSRAWQSWLTANTLGVDCIVWIEDREQPLLTRRRTKQGVNTNYGVPVAWFFGAESPRDVFRRLFRDIWHFTADKLGLPEPPPVPRHHRLATLSRHLMFGSWISMEHTNVAEPEGSPRDMALARARHDFDQDPAWRAWMNECAPLDVCGYLRGRRPRRLDQDSPDGNRHEHQSHCSAVVFPHACDRTLGSALPRRVQRLGADDVGRGCPTLLLASAPTPASVRRRPTS